MKNWKKWTIWGAVGAWVALVIVMFASRDVAMMVGWITPIGLLFLAILGIFVGAAVKFLRQSKS